jgi:23S rRNA (uridine2552-2'-O)-methyltransferase
MQERHRLMKPGGAVLDLGAAPGAWSQYAAGVVRQKGRVIAVDLLEMDPIAGVEFVQGDFSEPETLSRVLHCIAEQRLDLVMSDMAPNISGNRSVDQPRTMYLAELAADLARQVLKPGGSMVLKLFHGEGFDEFVRNMRQEFGGVRVRKPAASRTQSRETYMVATDFRV